MMRSASQPGRPRERGFTLIELLVAVAIFAIMATLAYTGLASVLQARAQTGEAAAQLAELQFAVSRLSHDVQQALPRAIRDGFGEPLPALRGTSRQVEFTRAGFANPTGLKRATLERIAWTLEADGLTRWSWPVLDRARATVPFEQPVLGDVLNLRWRYFDQGIWYEQWPPLSARDTGASMWPDAIEFILTVRDMGRISRVVPLVAQDDTVVLGASR